MRRWCNHHLAKRGKKISDLWSGFSTGLLLATLAEVLSGGKATIAGIKPKPRLRVQKIDNNYLVLNFFRDQGINLHGIEATCTFLILNNFNFVTT